MSTSMASHTSTLGEKSSLSPGHIELAIAPPCQSSLSACLEGLPQDSLQSVLGLLGARDLSRCGVVSRHLNATSDARELWARVIVHDFGLDPAQIEDGHGSDDGGIGLNAQQQQQRHSRQTLASGTGSAVRGSSNSGSSSSRFPEGGQSLGLLFGVQPPSGGRGGGRSSTTHPNIPDPKREYATRYRARARRLRQEAQRRARAQREAAAAVRQGRLSRGLGFLIRYCGTCCPFLVLLLFSVLVVLKLDGGGGMTAAAVVFVPVWLLLLLACGIFGCSCLAYRRRDAPRTSAWHHQWQDLNDTLPVFLIQDVFRERRRALVHGCCGGVLLLLTPIMVCVKLSFPGVATFYWSAALVPLWLFFLWWLLAPCCKWTFSESDHYIGFIMLTLLLWLPVLSVCVVLSIKLDGAHIPLKLALIPFWIINSLLFCLGTCGYVVEAVKRLRQRERRRQAMRENTAAYCLGCLLFVPLLIFQILLACRDDGLLQDTSYAAIFAPLFLWESLAVIVSCLLGFKAAYSGGG